MKRTLQISSITFLTILCTLITTAPQAKANTDAFHSFDNEVWIAAGVDFLAYKESVPPPTLTDSERDGIASLAGGINFLSGEENLYWGLEGSVAYGDANYSGAYLASPTTPLNGTTRETISTVDGKFGKGFYLTDNLMLIPYGELGYRYWDRNLGGGQSEDYQNFDILGGLMLQVTPMDTMIVSLYGSGGTTFDSKMTTSGLSFDLGSSAVYKAGAKVGYDLTDRTELFTTLDFEHFSFGESGDVDGLYEPNSNTNETAVRVGLAYHFQ